MGAIIEKPINSIWGCAYRYILRQIMRNISLIASFLLIFFAASNIVNAQGNRVILKNECPKADEASSIETPGTVALIASAVIPRIIGGGLNLLSAKITNAAKAEQVVATTSVGDYLYTYDNPVDEESRLFNQPGNILLKYGCVIYASKGVNSEKQWPQKEYPSCKLYGRDVTKSPLKGYGNDADTCELLKFLEVYKYEPESPPRTLLVATVDVSKDKTAFRLVPIYLFYAASPNDNDKKKNAKKRSLTFNFSLSRPDPNNSSGRTVFAVPNIIFSEIAPGVVKRNGKEEIFIFNNESSNLITSQWFVVPSVSDINEEKIKQDESLLQELKLNQISADQTYEFALEQVEELGKYETSNNEFQSIENELIKLIQSHNKHCDSNGDNKYWYQKLQKNQALIRKYELYIDKLNDDLKFKKDKETVTSLRSQLGDYKTVVKSIELLSNYASACQKIKFNSSEREELLRVMSHIEPMDITLNVIESSERPFLEFISSILEDQTLHKELTEAIALSIDPVKREELAREKASARRKAIETYEQAFIDAQMKELDLEAIDGAKKPLEKRKANINLRFARVKANRLADELNMPLPFPGTGIQY